jgi:hypothetical protein
MSRKTIGKLVNNPNPKELIEILKKIEGISEVNILTSEKETSSNEEMNLIAFEYNGEIKNMYIFYNIIDSEGSSINPVIKTPYMYLSIGFNEDNIEIIKQIVSKMSGYLIKDDSEEEIYEFMEAKNYKTPLTNQIQEIIKLSPNMTTLEREVFINSINNNMELTKKIIHSEESRKKKKKKKIKTFNLI